MNRCLQCGEDVSVSCLGSVWRRGVTRRRAERSDRADPSCPRNQTVSRPSGTSWLSERWPRTCLFRTRREKEYRQGRIQDLKMGGSIQKWYCKVGKNFSIKQVILGVKNAVINISQIHNLHKFHPYSAYNSKSSPHYLQASKGSHISDRVNTGTGITHLKKPTLF